jgi:hypothetical protein
MKFDVGECIRNPEFKEFFRKQDLKVWDMIQIILHSYASMQQKREWLCRLLQTVGEEEKQEVQNMLDLVDLCLRQIYQTDENVVYVAEYRNTTEPDDLPPDVIITSENAELTFHDDIMEMTEYLERIYTPEPDDEVNREMYIYQIIKAPHEKHRIKLEFSMTWFDGKLGIFDMYPNREWLEQEGISEETYNDFKDVGGGICYRELPFATGDRLRIKTPLMRDYVYGTILAEYDGWCWYYWFTPDGKETDDDLITLTYHEIDLTSGYAVYDWVEKVKD